MLRELQRDFRRHLLGGSAGDLVGAILPDGLTPQARLQVYRNHVAISLREAMRTTFPVVYRLVGESFFAGMARAFVAGHPPATPCLSEFGDAFADFIAGYAAAADLPYLADVARLEWALNRAWHSPYPAALPAAALSAVDADELAQSSLVLQPALQLLSSSYPVEAIWRSNQPEQDGSGVDLSQPGGTLLVWRERQDAVFRAVDIKTAAFSRRVVSGERLELAFEEPDAAESLGLLFRLGLVVDVQSPGRQSNT